MGGGWHLLCQRGGCTCAQLPCTWERAHLGGVSREKGDRARGHCWTGLSYRCPWASVMELQRKTGKAEVLPRAPQRPRASLGKTLQRWTHCAGLAGAKSSWFLSFLPLHRWKAVLPPYLWVQEPGLQVHWPKNQLFCLLILESFPSSGREHHSHLPQHRTGREHLKHPCNSQNHHREKFRQRLYISHMKQQTLQHWMHRRLISPIPTSFKIIPGFCNHQNWHSTTVCQWIETSVFTHHKVIPCRQRKCEQSKSIRASTGERWSIWQ